MSFRFPVRHGTTTRTLAESEVAHRYRDRFAHATADEAHIDSIRRDGDGDLDRDKHWIAVALVPATRGSIPLTTRADRLQAFRRSLRLAERCLDNREWPNQPKPGRRRMRFDGKVSGHLHDDGCAYLAYRLNVQTQAHGSPRLYLHTFELGLLTVVQGVIAWALESGTSGDATISAHCVSDGTGPLELTLGETSFSETSSGPLPGRPTRMTVALDTLATDAAETVVVAHALAADLLADLGQDEPALLPKDGLLRTAMLGPWQGHAQGWETRWTSRGD